NSSEGDTKFSTMDVPLLLGTRVGAGPFGARIQLGPLISFVLDEENSFVEHISAAGDFKEYKNQSFAINGGVGVDISKFTADLRFEHGLSDVYDNANDENNGKLKLLTLSVKYRLF